MMDSEEQGTCLQLRERVGQIVENFFKRTRIVEGSACPSTGHVCPSLKVWSSTSEEKTYSLMCSGKKCSWVIPLGGNAFITERPLDEDPTDNFVSDCGIAKWNNEARKFSTFFHSTRPGYVLLALRLRVPEVGSRSTIRITVSHAKPPNDAKEECEIKELGPEVRLCRSSCGRQSQMTEVDITGSNWQLVHCGKFYLPFDGYIRFDLEGLTRSGPYFADVTHLVLVPESDWFQEQTCVKFVSDPSDFYFGRRGPSVHLRYILPQNTNLEYFYTELTAPLGQDVIGSYFCAAGFRGGYFGMQVNSDSERRILFSVWSAWDTDDPEQIPEDYKVILLKKGPDVIDGEFGHEGSGGQSYLIYPWVAGQTYRFLVYATKSGTEDTIYTAWFNVSGQPTDWRLIASFFKPKDSTFLTDLYAFSENFIPEQGHLERQCLFGHQWVCDTLGYWREVTTAEFTADQTAKVQNRMDISAGLDQPSGQFFLRNCGFFSDKVEANTMFDRPATGFPPQIDFDLLP